MKHFILFSVLCAFSFMMTMGQELSPAIFCSGSHDYQDENMSWYGTLGGVFTETFNNSNCIITQGFQQGAIATLGVEELLQPIDLAVFPNPVTEYFVLVPKNQPEDFPWSLKVYDINGALKLSREINDQHEKVDVSPLPKGLYVLKVFQGRRLPAVFKFIKI